MTTLSDRTELHLSLKFQTIYTRYCHIKVPHVPQSQNIQNLTQTLSFLKSPPPVVRFLVNNTIHQPGHPFDASLIQAPHSINQEVLLVSPKYLSNLCLASATAMSFL